MKLCHGTAADNLDDILSNGLVPRGTSKSVWNAHPSATDRVYLTNCYAMYFAFNAGDKEKNMEGRGLIVEVDVNPDMLVPDEDTLAQATNQPTYRLAKSSNAVRTRYWRRYAKYYDHLTSYTMDMMGTCAHMGAIAPEQITRYWVFDITPELIFSHDPAGISIVHHQLIGGQYKAQQQNWMDNNSIQFQSGDNHVLNQTTR